MIDDRISRTAQMTAYSRGYHYEHDFPRIFTDPLANQILSDEERVSIEEQMLAALRAANPAGAAALADRAAALRWIMHAGAAAPILLARASYAEECLEECVAEGVGQYVILGAGLDTFAFRRPDLRQGLRVLEVDHPATQGYKRRRLAELGWEQPEELSFIPVDFARESLYDALTGSLDPHIPTFFSWLGVTYYLTSEAVFAMLAQLARFAPAGSTLVFDYLDNDAYEASKASPRVMRMLWGVRQLGEPMQSGFEPATLAEDLALAGLELVADLSPWDIHLRYFLGRTDHYRACEHAHLARVRTS